MHIQLLVLGAIATIVFLILRVKKGGLPAAVAKTCASIFFVFTGLASAFDSLPAFGSLSVGFATFNPWSFYIIGGLVCAVLGDLWLDLKYTYLENSNEFTALGMSFFLGTQTVRMLAFLAASIFSFRPPMGSTRPRRVISPVIATSERTLRPVMADSMAVAMVMPAEGPSLGTAPSGMWM